jgi:hypothetical protein
MYAKGQNLARFQPARVQIQEQFGATGCAGSLALAENAGAG